MSVQLENRVISSVQWHIRNKTSPCLHQCNIWGLIVLPQPVFSESPCVSVYELTEAFLLFLSLQQSVHLIMASGALFPSMVSGSRGSSSKYLVEFRAGKMTMKGSTVTPDKRKGQVYIQQTDDSLIHFCWKDRTTGNVDDVGDTVWMGCWLDLSLNVRMNPFYCSHLGPDHLPWWLRVQAGEPVHHRTSLCVEVQGWLQKTLLLDAGMYLNGLSRTAVSMKFSSSLDSGHNDKTLFTRDKFTTAGKDTAIRRLYSLHVHLVFYSNFNLKVQKAILERENQISQVIKYWVWVGRLSYFF